MLIFSSAAEMNWQYKLYQSYEYSIPKYYYSVPCAWVYSNAKRLRN